jgi:hypothetical protein
MGAFGTAATGHFFFAQTGHYHFAATKYASPFDKPGSASI